MAGRTIRASCPEPGKRGSSRTAVAASGACNAVDVWAGPFCARARPASRALWLATGTARHIAPCPGFLDRRAKAFELPARDCRAHVRHHFLIVSEIDGGEQDCAKHLVGLEKMMQIGPAIVARGRTAAVRIEGP